VALGVLCRSPCLGFEYERILLEHLSCLRFLSLSLARPFALRRVVLIGRKLSGIDGAAQPVIFTDAQSRHFLCTLVCSDASAADLRDARLPFSTSARRTGVFAIAEKVASGHSIGLELARGNLHAHTSAIGRRHACRTHLVSCQTPRLDVGGQSGWPPRAAPPHSPPLIYRRMYRSSPAYSLLINSGVPVLGSPNLRLCCAQTQPGGSGPLEGPCTRCTCTCCCPNHQRHPSFHRADCAP
jgi:hypothetical protein